MGRPIHEKINLLLTERGQKKKELAKALGISPQTMTDITKGRSSVTLQHLRGLVRFFNLRADYWLDDERDAPGDTDNQTAAATAGSGDTGVRREPDNRPAFLRAPNSSEFMDKMRTFLRSHQEEWDRTFGPIKPQERELLEPRDDRRTQRPGAAGGTTSGAAQVAAD